MSKASGSSSAQFAEQVPAASRAEHRDIGGDDIYKVDDIVTFRVAVVGTIARLETLGGDRRSRSLMNGTTFTRSRLRTFWKRLVGEGLATFLPHQLPMELNHVLLGTQRWRLNLQIENHRHLHLKGP